MLNHEFYSDNQKNVQKEDDIKTILKFDFDIAYCYKVPWTILSHNLSLKVDFIFQRFLVITVVKSLNQCI